MAQAKNPFTWVEIYVEDMSRAQKFYEAVLAFRCLAFHGLKDRPISVAHW